MPEARLTLVARRRALLEELAAELPVPTHVVSADLSEDDDAWLERAQEAQGPVDVLVNNAGAQVVAPTAAVDVTRGEASVRLNLLTPLRLIAKVLPQMTARGSGHVVNVASMAALAPTPGMTYYNASKGGLAAASEALRGELRGSGVSVLTVYPGIIAETDMATAALSAYESNAALRWQPTASAEELAREVRVSMERRRARLVFPRVYGITRWFPTIVRWFMDRFTPRLTAPA